MHETAANMMLKFAARLGKGGLGKCNERVGGQERHNVKPTCEEIVTITETPPRPSNAFLSLGLSPSDQLDSPVTHSSKSVRSLHYSTEDMDNLRAEYQQLVCHYDVMYFVTNFGV